MYLKNWNWKVLLKQNLKRKNAKSESKQSNSRPKMRPRLLSGTRLLFKSTISFEIERRYLSWLLKMFKKTLFPKNPFISAIIRAKNRNLKDISRNNTNKILGKYFSWMVATKNKIIDSYYLFTIFWILYIWIMLTCILQILFFILN